MSGVIGDVLSVDFHWMLNTPHGADYFRRWHSYKKMSGGLMVHKATHHFDLVNWWLSANPVSVYANGKREFYTPAMAKRLGLPGPHERCHTCPEKQTCGFELDLAANANLKQLYLDNEQHDGYFRDRCVFRPDIEIEDTMNVIVTYDNGVTLSLLAQRLQRLGGLPHRLQRHEGAARAQDRGAGLDQRRRLGAGRDQGRRHLHPHLPAARSRRTR